MSSFWQYLHPTSFPENSFQVVHMRLSIRWSQLSWQLLLFMSNGKLSQTSIPQHQQTNLIIFTVRPTATNIKLLSKDIIYQLPSSSNHWHGFALTSIAIFYELRILKYDLINWCIITRHQAVLPLLICVSVRFIYHFIKIKGTKAMSWRSHTTRHWKIKILTINNILDFDEFSCSIKGFSSTTEISLKSFSLLSIFRTFLSFSKQLRNSWNLKL